jgi:hypothetical protein
MEAGTPPTGGSQTADLESRLDALTTSISEATNRVNVDLGHLRSEIENLNAQHADVDLQPVIDRVDNLIIQVNNIDVTNVTESGPGDATVQDGGVGDAGEDPAATDEPGSAPVEADQGESVEGDPAEG